MHIFISVTIAQLLLNEQQTRAQSVRYSVEYLTYWIKLKCCRLDCVLPPNVQLFFSTWQTEKIKQKEDIMKVTWIAIKFQCRL